LIFPVRSASAKNSSMALLESISACRKAAREAVPPGIFFRLFAKARERRSSQ
jgi:hypothetical protein